MKNTVTTSITLNLKSILLDPFFPLFFGILATLLAYYLNSGPHHFIGGCLIGFGIRYLIYKFFGLISNYNILIANHILTVAQVVFGIRVSSEQIAIQQITVTNINTYQIGQKEYYQLEIIGDDKIIIGQRPNHITKKNLIQLKEMIDQHISQISLPKKH